MPLHDLLYVKTLKESYNSACAVLEPGTVPDFRTSTFVKTAGLRKHFTT